MAANMKIIHAINQMSIAFKPEALGEVSLEKRVTIVYILETRVWYKLIILLSSYTLPLILVSTEYHQ